MPKGCTSVCLTQLIQLNTQGLEPLSSKVFHNSSQTLSHPSQHINSGSGQFCTLKAHPKLSLILLPIYWSWIRFITPPVPIRYVMLAHCWMHPSDYSWKWFHLLSLALWAVLNMFGRRASLCGVCTFCLGVNNWVAVLALKELGAWPERVPEVWNRDFREHLVQPFQVEAWNFRVNRGQTTNPGSQNDLAAKARLKSSSLLPGSPLPMAP